MPLLSPSSAAVLSCRRFWLWWCDGLTVLDLLVIVLWAAINASWMAALITQNRQSAVHRMATAAPSLAVHRPSPSKIVSLVAKSLGGLLAPNLVVLFYPISRGSVVLPALGLSYPAAIRYLSCCTTESVHFCHVGVELDPRHTRETTTRTVFFLFIP